MKSSSLSLGIFIFIGIAMGIAFHHEAESTALAGRENAKNQRVMVMLQSIETDISYIPIMIEASRSIENYIENELRQNGFEVIDATQFSTIKEVESALNKRDPALLAAVLKNFGAEIVVYGEVRREFVNLREIHGTTYRFFSNELNLKAVEAASGMVIYSGMQLKNPSALENYDVLLEAASSLVSVMIKDLMKKEQGQIPESKKIDITVFNILFSQLPALKDAFGNIAGVGSVTTKSFKDGIAVLQVDYQGSVERLAAILAAMPDPDMEISRMETNTIHLKIKK